MRNKSRHLLLFLLAGTLSVQSLTAGENRPQDPATVLARQQAAQSGTFRLRQEAENLLKEWTDTLLGYQVSHPDPSLDGGLLCPACARIHGRCGDWVLPLMYMADKTKQEKYLHAARRLMHWMGNVRNSDGSWMNDVNVSDWNGTTVFAAIALYESLHNHGQLLDDSTRNEWEKQLLEAGEFIHGNRFIYSRRREGMRNMNVNYSASATYALYAIGQKFGRKDFMEQARQTANDLKVFFTENELFLFGEGPEIHRKTKNGCFPVDLLYNVEESLPNMVCYARMAGDRELLEILDRSMMTHLAFMLPDGAWDNSWGTRNFKWTYWGGRTSDGFMGGYYALADRHPEYAEAISRNIGLLRRATSGGLLHGGMHNRASGMKACIHHTFGHSKALASFLDLPSVPFRPCKLPRDTAYGVKFFKDINTYLASTEDWRATVTAFDAEYKVKGTHPMGGVLSMLWHKKAGPVFAASMNLYTMIEAPNMQACTKEHLSATTPRIELMENGTMFSNLDDLDADIRHTSEGENHCSHVTAHLTDIRQRYSEAAGSRPVEMEIRFEGGRVKICSYLSPELKAAGARLVLPVISAPGEQAKAEPLRLTVRKPQGSLVLESRQPIEILPTNADGRIFNPVPGFSVIPASIAPDGEGRIEVSLSFAE